jgi:hypothetical protein
MLAWNLVQAATMNEIGANFLTCVAALAFAVLGFSCALEVVKESVKKEEEQKYLMSIARYSILIIVSTLLPIAIAEYRAPYVWSSLFLALFSTILFVFTVYEIFTRKVSIKYTLISYPLLIITALVIVLVWANGFFWGSAVIFKVAVLWALFALCARFFLFVRNLIESASQKDVHGK